MAKDKESKKVKKKKGKKKKKVLKDIKKIDSTKQETILQVGDFRIVKADRLNWVVDYKNSKGEFGSIGKRSYYQNLESAAIAILKKIVLTTKDEKTIKDLIATIQHAEKRIIEAIKSH